MLNVSTLHPIDVIYMVVKISILSYFEIVMLKLYAYIKRVTPNYHNITSFPGYLFLIVVKISTVFSEGIFNSCTISSKI